MPKMLMGDIRCTASPNITINFGVTFFCDADYNDRETYR